MLNYYINNKNKSLFMLHCLILCITSYFFLHFDYFLLSDYPNYLARINLYNHLSDTQNILSEYYYKDMKITPYMAFPVFVSMLEPVVGIYWAGKLFIVFAISVIISGGVFLNYTIYNRITPFSLFLHIFIFNFTLSMGFLNFTLGLGLILWGFALWIRYHHNTLKFYVLFSIYGIVIFFCHVFALFLLGLLIGLYQLSLKPMTSVKGFFKAAFYASLKVLTFTLIPVIITLMIRDNNGIQFPTVTAYDESFITNFSIAYLTPLIFHLDSLRASVCITLFMILFILKKIELKQQFVISVLFIVSFFIPFTVAGVACANERIPALVGLLFAVSATFKGQEKHIVFCSTITGILSVFLYTNNITLLHTHNSWASEFIKEIKDDTNLNGKRLITVNDDDDVHNHNLSNYATLEADMFDPELMIYIPPMSMYKKYAKIYGCQSGAILSKNLRMSDSEAQKYIKPKEPKEPKVQTICSNDFHWRHWRHDFDYVFWIHFDDKPKNVPAELTPYKKGSFFTLYKIEK